MATTTKEAWAAALIEAAVAGTEAELRLRLAKVKAADSLKCAKGLQAHLNEIMGSVVKAVWQGRVAEIGRAIRSNSKYATSKPRRDAAEGVKGVVHEAEMAAARVVQARKMAACADELYSIRLADLVTACEEVSQAINDLEGGDDEDV
jgi:hypothetical protein